MAVRSTLIRNEPCPKCGAYMIWTEHAWRPRAPQPGGAASGSDRVAAYVCENPTCGLVLDPTQHPRDVTP